MDPNVAVSSGASGIVPGVQFEELSHRVLELLDHAEDTAQTAPDGTAINSPSTVRKILRDAFIVARMAERNGHVKNKHNRLHGFFHAFRLSGRPNPGKGSPEGFSFAYWLADEAVLS
jgi:hypothetical protein